MVTLNDFIADLVKIRDDEDLGNAPVSFATLRRQTRNDQGRIETKMRTRRLLCVSKLYGSATHLLDEPARRETALVLLSWDGHDKEVTFDGPGYLDGPRVVT